MPQLDFTSMAVLIALNLVVIGCALPWVMGSPVSRAALHVQRYFVCQALAWICILAAGKSRGSTWDPVLSISATVLASLALWQMYQALTHWLGPRPLRHSLAVLCCIGPLGFALLFEHQSLRMSWYSLMHAAIMACLAYSCLRPLRPAAHSWRKMMAACGVVMALMLTTRAAMSLWTPWLLDFTQDTHINYLFVIISHVCGSLLLVCLLVAWRDETNQQLRDMAMTDALTGLPNRRALLHTAPLMQAMAKRQKLPLALVIMDLDHFKTVNDHHGHHIGDQALQLFAQVLREQVRQDEMVARWGGEEFCLLMYADPAGIHVCYERIREALAQRSSEVLGFRLQLSAGFALQNDQHTLEQLMQQADQALYCSKAQGRNRITAYHPELGTFAVEAAQDLHPEPV